MPSVVLNTRETTDLAAEKELNDFDAVSSKTLSSEVNFENLYEDLSNLNPFFRESARRNLKLRPNPRSLTQLGDIHFANKKYAKAQQAYKNALSMQRNSPEILKKLVQVSVNLGKSDDANRYFNLLINVVDFRPEIINDYLNFRISRFISTEESFKESIEIAESFHNKFPHIADFANALGLMYLLRDPQNDKAEHFFKKAIKVQSHHIHAVNNLGVYYQSRGDYPKAYKYFSKAMGIDFRYKYAHQNLATNYAKEEQIDKVIETLLSAYDANVELDLEWQGNLAQLLIDHKGDFPKSQTILKGLHERDPLNPRIINNLAVSYMRQKSYEIAAAYLEEARVLIKNQYRVRKKIDPTAYIILFNLAKLLNDTGKSSKAQIICDEINKHFPKFYPSYNLKAKIMMNDNNLKEAKDLLLRSLRIDPHHLETAINLSYIYDVHDLNYRAALDILHPYLDEPGDEPRLHDLVLNNYAYALLKLNYLDEAEPILEVLKDSPYSLATRAVYNMKKGNITQASRFYKESIAFFDKTYDDLNKNMNILFSHFEFAQYYWENKDYVNTKKHVEAGLAINLNSGARKYLLDLQEKLASHSTKP